MKNIIKSTLFVTSIILLQGMFGCNKSEVKEVQNNGAVKDKNGVSFARGGGGNTQTLSYTSEGTDCQPPAINCWSDIVVSSAYIIQIISELEEADINGDREIFFRNKDFLTTIFQNSDVERILKGEGLVEIQNGSKENKLENGDIIESEENQVS